MKNINLGGFPPIFFVQNIDKKKREFKEKKNLDKINSKVLNSINILDFTNILGKKNNI
jgi:hypothetical protein